MTGQSAAVHLPYDDLAVYNAVAGGPLNFNRTFHAAREAVSRRDAAWKDLRVIRREAVQRRLARRRAAVRHGVCTAVLLAVVGVCAFVCGGYGMLLLLAGLIGG